MRDHGDLLVGMALGQVRDARLYAHSQLRQALTFGGTPNGVARLPGLAIDGELRLQLLPAEAFELPKVALSEGRHHRGGETQGLGQVWAVAWARDKSLQ